MLRRRWLVGLGVVAAALLLVVPSAAGYYTDWLWYRELGYEGMFLRGLNAQAIVFAATFASVFLFLLVNFHIARAAVRRPHMIVTPHGGRPLTVERADIAGWVTPAATILALMFGLSGATNWLSWLS